MSSRPRSPPRSLPCAALAALLAALLAMPPAAALLEDYQLLPTEHDDLGRSDEPDLQATSVLGPFVRNCVLSFNPLSTPGTTRACVADNSLPPPPGIARVVAPGCWDDDGPEQSGTCGLYTQGVRQGDVVVVAPGQLGRSGMTRGKAPGAYTPTSSTAIRLLDIRADALLVDGAFTGGDRLIDVNHKLADSPAPSLLGQVDAGSAFIPASASFWAWYGVWQDRNGNGVIDHLGDQEGHAEAGNEFRWVGKCGGDVSGDVCIPEAGLAFPLWLWPGNHHQSCGLFIGCLVPPADMPGKQPFCLVVGPLGVPTLQCDAPDHLDDEETGGDPLLGPQDSVAADGAMLDETDQAQLTQRGWKLGSAGGSSPPAMFYDQSLLVTTLVVGGPTKGGLDLGLPQHFDLAKLQFVDVDAYSTWSPAAESLLTTVVKPTARSLWLTVRDDPGPVANYADQQVNARSLDVSPPLTPVRQRFVDPGWAREPNTAMDVEPGAVFDNALPSGELAPGEQLFRGWLNDMSGYRGAWHAFADVQAQRVEFTYGRFTVLGNCLPAPFCGIGGVVGDGISAGVRGDGDHGRSLDPGAYVFHGFVGAWRDRSQRMDERVLDPLATVQHRALAIDEDAYTLPPDGWVGNIVNTTGGFHYRGYNDTICTIHGVRALRSYSACNPYRDDSNARVNAFQGADQGAGVDISDPQDYGSDEVLPTSPPLQAYDVVLTPAGGRWNVPVLVWRDFFTWAVGDTSVIEDHTGTSDPIVLHILPDRNPSFPQTSDLLILPAGNLGQAVQSTVQGMVTVNSPAQGVFVNEYVRDVDVYRAFVTG